MTEDHETSSGNVFADIGLPDAEQELLKAKLTVEVYRLLSNSGLMQQEAARLLRTTQPRVSALMRCKPISVSVGKLMEFLTILGRDVEVKVKPAKRRDAGPGRLSVVVQAG
jgi:predicted XRE-type DNA-binding protein